MWPESLKPLYEQAASAAPEGMLASQGQWSERLAEWVRAATLEERLTAQAAALSQLGTGDRSAGELLFLLAHSSELLWPYPEAPRELLHRLTSRQAQLVQSLQGQGTPEALEPLTRAVAAESSKVLARYLKRHPEGLLALVEGVRCTFDGKVLRFDGAVELDLKAFLSSERRSIARIDQLRLLLPHLAEGRDRMLDFIRERAGRIPWRECCDFLEEKLFQRVLSPEGRSGLRGLLACYPNGRNEARWCSRASVLLARHLEEGGAPAVLENLCELLVFFTQPPADGLRGALQALVASRQGVKDLGPARLIADHCWERLRPKEPGLLGVLLWVEEGLFREGVRRGLPEAFERRNRAHERVRELPLAEHLCWLAEESTELWARFESGARPGADELAAWRREVVRRFGRRPVQRQAVSEFFLWCAPDAAASEAELVTLSLVKTATDKRALKRLGQHPSPRVRSRVRVIQSWLEPGGAPAPGAPAPATLTEALQHLRASSAVVSGGGRTWLRDRDLEELLLGLFSRVEQDFTAHYPEHAREEELQLVTRLLEGLKRESERIGADLSNLLAQGQPVPRVLDLQYRKGTDEAGRPPGPVEVAFVLTVEAEPFLRTKRAVLVQVRKLEERGEGQWAPSFRVQREQVDALLGVTEAAFCLFLVPPILRSECQVVPARLVREVMETQGSLTQAPREGIHRPARSLAQWLTYDVLGLWTGDERPTVLERAEGRTEPRPDFTVELTLRKGTVAG
jgi:hypothetical protein